MLPIIRQINLDWKNPTRLEFMAEPGFPWTEMMWEKMMWTSHTSAWIAFFFRPRGYINQNSGWSSYEPLGVDLWKDVRRRPVQPFTPKLFMPRWRPRNPGNSREEGWVLREALCILGGVTLGARAANWGHRQEELFMAPFSSSPTSNCL